MKETNSTNDSLGREEYLAERKILISGELEGSRSFDKHILILSSGALGLSLTFIRNIIPQNNIQSKELLVIAWGCLCFSLLCTLISFLTSQSAYRRQREILDQQYSKDNAQDITNKSASFTQFLNVVSMIIFIVGIILVIIFSSINLS